VSIEPNLARPAPITQSSQLTVAPHRLQGPRCRTADPAARLGALRLPTTTTQNVEPTTLSSGDPPMVTPWLWLPDLPSAVVPNPPLQHHKLNNTVGRSMPWRLTWTFSIPRNAVLSALMHCVSCPALRRCESVCRQLQ
jgi:hypothetical protein